MEREHRHDHDGALARRGYGVWPAGVEARSGAVDAGDTRHAFVSMGYVCRSCREDWSDVMWYIVLTRYGQEIQNTTTCRKILDTDFDSIGKRSLHGLKAGFTYKSLAVILFLVIAAWISSLAYRSHRR